MPRKADSAAAQMGRRWRSPQRRSLLAATLCGALLAACVTTQAPVNSGLTGQWQLDAAASDNVAMVVSSAIGKAQARMRKRRARFEGSQRAGGRGRRGGGDAGSGNPAGADSGTDEDLDSATDVFGTPTLLGPDFQQLRTNLMDTLGTSTRLSLEIQPDDIHVRRDNLPPRDYQPGERITRYDQYGAANVSSRWDGQAFELRERYTTGARLVERYDVDAAGALVYTRTLQDPTVGKLTVRSIYHRVSARG
jgi:hypothetical protein